MCSRADSLRSCRICDFDSSSSASSSSSSSSSSMLLYVHRDGLLGTGNSERKGTTSRRVTVSGESLTETEIPGVCVCGQSHKTVSTIFFIFIIIIIFLIFFFLGGGGRVDGKKRAEAGNRTDVVSLAYHLAKPPHRTFLFTGCAL